jgi:uncharacterized protein with von Willebrand factor type A (vWA) domain
MSERFSRFVNFGPDGARETRKKTAEEIYAALRDGVPFMSAERRRSLSAPRCDGNFSQAIGKILAHEPLRELARADCGLAEEFTREILGFVNSSAGKMALAENPFEKEEQLLREFEQTGEDGFAAVWDETNALIDGAYPPGVLDPEFYYNEFRAGNIGFDSVKEHFLEKWRKLLFQKRTDWELDFIDGQRRLFCEILYTQIEQLKELEEILEPLAGELGRLWDMSKGQWRKINPDILRKYAKLFKKDSSLQALADMLGRMRQAEKEYEEEIFAETVIKPDWKISQAGKAGLVGIHESGDLSCLLPSETALFAEDETALIFYKKFVEKKLQSFEYRNAERISVEKEEMKKRLKEKDADKGPFIICVDTSGSMQGTPETVAKTLCFAILKMAVCEGRECFLISFSDGARTLSLTDMQNDLEKIVEFFSMSFYGGTDPVPAMKEALAMLETRDYGKADIVMVSDFVMPPLDAETQRRVRAAKKNRTKFHSLVIGRSGNTKAIADFTTTGCTIRTIPAMS